MKLFAFSCLATAIVAKDIKQKMMENRLKELSMRYVGLKHTTTYMVEVIVLITVCIPMQKFDRDVVLNGDLEEDEEWDPWDLEDEELQVCRGLMSIFNSLCLF